MRGFIGTKKEIKEQITSVLEENFNFILNTQDSLLNLQNTLSTNELKISMYHIKTFMNNKGYTHDKITNEWSPINITIANPSNNEVIKDNENTLEASEHEIVEYKKILSESITDDLKEFLKENSNEINKNNIIELPSNIEESTEENLQKIITENIKENSLIPEDNILKEIWKITDNTASNCEVILSSLLSISKQLSENTLLLSCLNHTNNEVNDNSYFKIPSNQMIDIIHGDTKRYELTLVINFVDSIKKKFFLKHPEITALNKLKDTKILSMVLWDYLTSE